MKRMLLICTLLLFIFQIALFPQDDKMEKQSKDKQVSGQNDKMSHNEHDFLTEAASGGKMEVELGQVAMEKGSSEEVKQFGQKMVTDHSKANEELMSIVSKNNLKKPKDDMMDEHKKKVADLSNLTGTDFDKQYMKMMVEDHKKDVEEFEKASRNYEIDAVKQWAAKTLPTLKQHLELAQQINKKLQTADKDYH